MKIGIDCRSILNTKGGQLAGVGHYTYYLVKNLLELDKENEYLLFVDDKFCAEQDFSYDNCQIKKFPFYEYKKYLPIAYSQMLISSFLNRENLDLFHSPANVVPIFYNKPSVVTIHDLAIYKYPEFFPRSYVSRQAFSTKVLVPKTLIKARKIIAVSRNTKRDIIENFAIPEDKINVIYEGFDPVGEKLARSADFEKISAKFGIGEKYFLFVGTIEPRKNLPRMIRAFRNLLMTYDSPAKGYQLILAGNRGWYDDEIFDAICSANASILAKEKRRSGMERRCGFDKRTDELKMTEGERRNNIERRIGQPIKYIGYISNEEKFSLMANACSFVFPSIYEGFGLPILEAMSVGTPVITSNSSSLNELADNNCGILVDPLSEADISKAMQTIITDEGFGESARNNCLAKAGQFSWKKCAQETLEIYKTSIK